MIDPQAEAVRAVFNAGPPLEQVGVEQARRWLAEARAKREVTAVRHVADLTVGSIGVRLYHPNPAATLPVLVYAHGGGWVLGSVDTADEACRRLCNASGCAVLSVEYRLAPEARHPAPVHDMLQVLHWIPSVAAEQRLNPRRVAIAGESSGAHVALGAALAARTPLAAQLLVCPALDRRMATQSWAAFGDHYVPRRSQMAWMWNLYLGEHDEFQDAALDPATASLAGLPPTVLVVAEYDPLRDEALELARRMQDAGTPVEVIDCAGQIHPVFAHAPVVAACDRYLRHAAAAIAAELQPIVEEN
ncbi:MAG TPA: alpha/beta hydrolase [Polyangiales bacterium]|nr:alpha/beta hydrolase [Polyangiales bacterium]